MNGPAINAKMRRTGVLLTWLTLTALVGILFSVGPYVLLLSGRSGIPLGQLTKWIMAWSNLSFPVSVFALAAEVLAILVFLAGLFVWRNAVWSNRQWKLCARGIGFAGVLLAFICWFLNRVAVMSAK